MGTDPPRWLLTLLPKRADWPPVALWPPGPERTLPPDESFSVNSARPFKLASIVLRKERTYQPEKRSSKPQQLSASHTWCKPWEREGEGVYGEIGGAMDI